MFDYQKDQTVRIRDGFAYVGQMAKVTDVSKDWSGMISYRLDKFPGWWPQSSLEKATF